MSTELIRWEDNGYGSFHGHAGSVPGIFFKLLRPHAADDEWCLQPTTGLLGKIQYGPDPDELKARAGEMLREFIASLGAALPAEGSIDATARDRVASDLAHPVGQLAAMLCAMRKVTGADGDAWLNWIRGIDEAVNQAGMVFEALMDGEGEYVRVLPQMAAVMRGEKIADADHPLISKCECGGLARHKTRCYWRQGFGSVIVSGDDHADD